MIIYRLRWCKWKCIHKINNIRVSNYCIIILEENKYVSKFCKTADLRSIFNVLAFNPGLQ